MLALNLIKKTLHTFCFEINARDYTVEWCWKNNPKKKKTI